MINWSVDRNYDLSNVVESNYFVWFFFKCHRSNIFCDSYIILSHVLYLDVSLKSQFPILFCFQVNSSATSDLSVVYSPTGTDATTYTCNVAMTSVSIRKKSPTLKTEEKVKTDEKVDDTNDVSKESDSVKDDYDEETCLPKEMCLKALAGSV